MIYFCWNWNNQKYFHFKKNRKLAKINHETKKNPKKCNSFALPSSVIVYYGYDHFTLYANGVNLSWVHISHLNSCYVRCNGKLTYLRRRKVYQAFQQTPSIQRETNWYQLYYICYMDTDGKSLFVSMKTWSLMQQNKNCITI